MLNLLGIRCSTNEILENTINDYLQYESQFAESRPPEHIHKQKSHHLHSIKQVVSPDTMDSIFSRVRDWISDKQHLPA